MFCFTLGLTKNVPLEPKRLLSTLVTYFHFRQQNHTLKISLMAINGHALMGRPRVSSREYPASPHVSAGFTLFHEPDFSCTTGSCGFQPFHLTALVMRRSGVRFPSRAPEIQRLSTASTTTSATTGVSHSTNVADR